MPEIKMEESALAVGIEKEGGRKVIADKIKYFRGGKSRDILDEAGRG